MSDVAFHFEVLKLLLQVAWADGVVAPEEAALLHELGTEWKLGAAELQVLEAHLKAGRGLPQPNLALLRERANQTMDVARQMVMSDGRLELDEVDVLGSIADLLQLKA